MSEVFSVDKNALVTLIENKDPKAINTHFQGILGLAKSLGTDLRAGLSREEIDEKFATRGKVYGFNVMPQKPPKSFFQLFFEALQDPTIIILMISAIISIVLGVTVEKESHGWIEGAAIIAAVMIVSLVTAGNDYHKEKQFRKLNAIKDDTPVKTVRAGEQNLISTHFVQVGDIVQLETGDKICADGILIEADELRVDESSMTGEADAIKKSPDTDPFLLAGCQVMEGRGTALIVAVGPNSQWGKIKALVEKESEDTPLQQHLEELASTIGKMGLVAAILTFLTLFTQWLNRQLNEDKPFQLAALGQLVEYLITSITIVVVAVPEGLPLAVTISLAYSMFKMMKDNNLVRHLEACETMGGATNICSDKTGTLTQNKMTVVKGWIGRLEYLDLTVNPGAMHKGVQDQLSFNMALNSTAFIKTMKGEAIPVTLDFKQFDKNGDGTISKAEFELEMAKYLPKEGKQYVGSKTECAMLELLERFGIDYNHIRTRYPPKKLIPFSSTKKRMAAVMPKDASGRSTVYIKGASEQVLGLCSHALDKEGNIIDISQVRDEANNRIFSYASEGLRTIALAFGMFQPPNPQENWEDVPDQGYVLIGIVGIKDPVRPEVPQAVQDCINAGITVRMLTGDNILTAKHIARECGIFREGGIGIEGPDFRRLSDEEVDKILPTLQVMARCSPQDKHRLVQRLRQKGEVVAVTGDGTNDAPQLKEADVGFAMGIAGTEVAKDASDIILLDDNFSSIVKAVMWGRNVFDSIRKFVQFQTTVNIVAVVIAFVGAVSNGESPLKPVQMLWVNLIMDTFAALALATAPPHPDLLKRRPYGRFEGIITPTMWRNIIGQAIFQLSVLFVLLYGIHVLPFFGLQGTHPSKFNDAQHTLHVTIIFNTFVFCQLFNEINATKLGNEFNILSGVFTNPIFIIILIGTAVVQALLVQLGGEVVNVTPLNAGQWIGCIALASLSLAVGVVLRLIPVSALRRPAILQPAPAKGPAAKRQVKRAMSFKVPPEARPALARRDSILGFN